MKKWAVVLIASILSLGIGSCDSLNKEVKTYTVTYSSAGSTGGNAPVDSRTYVQGDQVTLMNAGTLVQQGSTFTGWNTAETGPGTDFAPGDTFTMGSNDVVFYPRWTTAQVSVTLSFHANGGAGTMAPLVKNAGESLTLPACTLSREGFSFTGWNTDQEGDGTDYEDQSVLTVPGTDLTLFAQWIPTPGVALWARSTTKGTNVSVFNKGACDSEGNTYAVGRQGGAAGFGSGVETSLRGACLVKYSPQGEALWVRTADAAVTNGSINFYDTAVDSLGNVYVAGLIDGANEYSFGGKVVQGGYTAENPLLIKYSPDGVVQWVRSTLPGAGAETTTTSSWFNTVTVDSQGNVYVAGEQGGQGYTLWGEGVGLSTANGSYFGNALVVKFSSAGTPLWAQGPTDGAYNTRFDGCGTDAAGNVYLAGVQNANSSVSWGNGSVVSSTAAVTWASLVVKFSGTGTALWAKAASDGDRSSFTDLAVSTEGDVYAVGAQAGDGSYTYGPGVSAAATGTPNEGRFLLVKYSTSGNALWAQAVGKDTSGTALGYAVALGPQGRIYTAGYQGGGTFTYGTGKTASATGLVTNKTNALVVCWDSTGGALWARTPTVTGDYTKFTGLACDGKGGVLALGGQEGTIPITYGPEASASGSSTGYNAVIVKYRE